MTDWDLAYDNRAHVKDAESVYLSRWKASATDFREAMTLRGSCELSLPYGDGARNTYDVFEPVYETKGTVIFIHGGYWRALDKSWFSHLASGPLAHGWRVAIPSGRPCRDR